MTDDHNVLSGVKSVTQAGGNDYHVVFDASRLYTYFDEANWKKEGMTDEQVRVLAKVLQGLQKVGDVQTVVNDDPSDEAHFPHQPAFDGPAPQLGLDVKPTNSAAMMLKSRILSFIKMSEVNLTIDYTACLREPG